MNTCRKLLAAILVMMTALPALSAEYVPGDVLVVLKPAVKASSVSASTASFAAAKNASVKEIFPSLSASNGAVYALLHSDEKSPDELTRELLDDPSVLAASPNYVVRAARIPDDTFLSYCWGMSFINAYSAWDITTGSKDVYAAVIDSGIDDTNPDLTENIAAQYGRNTIGGSSARDDYGHGTHVAGIIGAVGNNDRGIAGVNWNVSLISIKALDKDGSGTIASVIAAINYAASLIQQGVNIKAVNLSLETYLPYAPTHDNLVSMPLWRAFKDLDVLNKAVIVCAAGNYGQPVGQPTTRSQTDVFDKGDYVYPASFTGLDNLISVSASDSDGNVASWSNFNATISAPGVSILSTWLQNVVTDFLNSTSLMQQRGTSMASPHVAGAAALLASLRPELTAYQIKRTILDASGSILDLRATLDHQTNAPEKSTEWTSYDDYSTYEVPQISYQNNGGGDGGNSSGCDAWGWNAFVLLLIVPISMSLPKR